MSNASTEISAIIASIDDTAAIRILADMAKPMMRNAAPDDPALQWTPELNRAICADQGVVVADRPAEAGALARQTLLLLSQDPQRAAAIAAMAKHRPAARFALDPVSGTLLVTAALLALQSHIEFERDKDGRWHFKYKKKPTKDGVITPLISKLVELISGGPPAVG